MAQKKSRQRKEAHEANSRELVQVMRRAIVALGGDCGRMLKDREYDTAIQLIKDLKITEDMINDLVREYEVFARLLKDFDRASEGFTSTAVVMLDKEMRINTDKLADALKHFCEAHHPRYGRAIGSMQVIDGRLIVSLS